MEVSSVFNIRGCASSASKPFSTTLHPHTPPSGCKGVGVGWGMEDGGAPPFLLVTMPRLNRELGASMCLLSPVGFPQVTWKGSFLMSQRGRFGHLHRSSWASSSRPDGGRRARGGSREIWGWSSLYRTKGPLGARLQPSGAVPLSRPLFAL